MRKDWQIKKLADICDVKHGYAFDGKEFSSDVPEENPIIITPGNFTEDGKLLFVEKNTKRFIGIPPAAFCFDVGDLVVVMTDLSSKMKILGKPAFVETNNVLHNQRIGRVRFFSDEINKRYVYYFMLSDQYLQNIKTSATGTMVKHTAPKRILDNEILLPSLPEQQRIVAILDEAFAGIATAKANTEKNLQNARAIFESHLSEVFSKKGEGWLEKKVSEVAKHSLGKMLDKAKNKGELQPYLRNLNVRWFSFDLSDLLQMPFLPSEVEKYTAVQGDVLICEGGYPGRAAIWNESHPIYFQKALHRVRFFEPEHNKWFVYFLYAQDKSGKLKQHFSGAGIQHFTGEVLAKYKVPFPPLSELRRAISKIEAVHSELEHLEAIYKQKLLALDELKKSLLHRAFSGEL